MTRTGLESSLCRAVAGVLGSALIVSLLKGCVIAEPDPMSGYHVAYAMTEAGEPELIVQNNCDLIRYIVIEDTGDREVRGDRAVTLMLTDAPIDQFPMPLQNLPSFVSVTKGDGHDLPFHPPFSVWMREQQGLLGSVTFTSSPKPGYATYYNRDFNQFDEVPIGKLHLEGGICDATK